jgi:hypothetical protein
MNSVCIVELNVSQLFTNKQNLLLLANLFLRQQAKAGGWSREATDILVQF